MGVPIFGPTLCISTPAKRAKGGAAPDPSLDAKGLPPGYHFDPSWEVTPREVKSLLDKREPFVFIDCRLPNEYAITNIEGAKLIPLGAVPANLQALDTDEDVICYCHHGMRSLDVAVWLRNQGVAGARSLAGGIERWSLEIDPQVPRY